MPTSVRAATGGRARGAAGGRRVPAWDDPAGRTLASLRAGGVPVAERRLLAGEPIYSEGDPDGNLYFVVSGSARVYKRYGPGGLREATVALVGAGASSGSPRWRGPGPTATTPRPPPKGAASPRSARRR